MGRSREIPLRIYNNKNSDSTIYLYITPWPTMRRCGLHRSVLTFATTGTREVTVNVPVQVIEESSWLKLRRIVGTNTGGKGLRHHIPSGVEEEGERIAVALGRHDPVRGSHETTVRPSVQELAGVYGDRVLNDVGRNPFTAAGLDLQAWLVRQG